jgi:hypothetical protein
MAEVECGHGVLRHMVKISVAQYNVRLHTRQQRFRKSSLGWRPKPASARHRSRPIGRAENLNILCQVFGASAASWKS